MEYGAYRHGSESQDSDEPMPPGIGYDDLKLTDSPSTSAQTQAQLIARGVENAKKKLRAFCIQKKAPVPPVTVVKPVCTGNTTVLIGRLASVKTTPKPEKPLDDEQKKPPKPPKPGCSKKNFNESYSDLQKRTLSEIEEMKRKMELVELGIPLGLVCPSTNALPVKVMPTKAMPPIKTFLDNAKIDEIIREARKAKAEGKEFKFDYQKFVPDYDNPFQRKKDNLDLKDDGEKNELEDKKKEEEPKKFRSDKQFFSDKAKDRRKSIRFDRRHDFKKDRDKHRDRHKEKDRKEESRSRDKDDKSRDRDRKSKDRDEKYKKEHDRKEVKVELTKEKEANKDKHEKKEEDNKKTEKDIKETDVNLNDYLVCDSWSLDTEGKSSPQVEDNIKKTTEDKSKKGLGKDVPIALDPLEQLRQSLGKTKPASPKPKIEKLKPVEDSFEFEIDPNEEIIDIYDEDDNIDKFDKNVKKDSLYDSPVLIKYDRNDLSNDNTNDETFLESVIDEIKLEHMSDDENHDRGLVEYDDSPRDSKEQSSGSITPDLEDISRGQSQTSDYSDGYKSTDSRKSIESGYKSVDSYKSYKKTASTSQDLEQSFSETKFKPIEAQKPDSDNKNERFKSTFKPAESDPNLENRFKPECISISKCSDRKVSQSDIRSPKIDAKFKSKLRKEDREFLSVEREFDEAFEAKMSKDTVNSLETWSFVLKICQPLLFRHDKNKCYKETRTAPKVWFTQNPRLCDCVTDRSIVYEELERCKMDLVNKLYGCDQIPDPPLVIARPWYPRLEQCIVENPAPMQLCSEWDLEDDQTRPGDRASMTPGRDEEVSLDREYQRFIEAVSWPESSQPSQDGRSMTPERSFRKTKVEDQLEDQPSSKRIKLGSEGWSQESEEDENTKSVKAKLKVKQKRKRKISSSPLSEDGGEKKRKKTLKKKEGKKAKSKVKRRRLEKKVLHKLKEKKKKKKISTVEEDSDFEEERETRKKDKRAKKKKQQKTKKKAEKKKKRSKSTSSSSDSSSSDSSTDSELEKKTKKKKKETDVKKKKKKEKKKKHKQSSSESQSEELFDVNVLNNIKSERLTDDERKQDTKIHREIINVKQLHDHFSSNVQVKQEVDEESNRSQPVIVSPKSPAPQQETCITIEEKHLETEAPKTPEEVTKTTEEVTKTTKEVTKITEDVTKKAEEAPKKVEVPKKEDEILKTEEVQRTSEVPKKSASVPKKMEKVTKDVEVPKIVEVDVEAMNRFDLDEPYTALESTEKVDFKEPEIPTPPPRLDDNSQCSSQESIQSITSMKEIAYEKDDSHLRPSCDNSNYSFNDVISSHGGYKLEEKFEGYENYEMYEQMAMAYQSDVASQQVSPPSEGGQQRIETVVRARSRGEIKCDWRPSDGPAPSAAARPSRWGLKPGEVNIVLTGGSDTFVDTHPHPHAHAHTHSHTHSHTHTHAHGEPQQVYKIQSLANREPAISYDEAYMDTYGAMDRLQYGDCFAPPAAPPPTAPPTAPPAAPPRAHTHAHTHNDPRIRSLDERINKVLQDTALREVAKDESADKDAPEKGILITKSLSGRGGKRVSFADGYKPGQDSDTEQPPAKKRARVRRVGCAWPCPVSHPDHVPLWDALPPPPPPPGSPPPPAPPPPPPLRLLRAPSAPASAPPPHAYRPTGNQPHKYNPTAPMGGFMPPEPPPGIITFT